MKLNLYSTTDGSNSVSYSVDAGSGNNRLMVVCFVGAVADDVTSVDWNSENFTLLEKQKVSHISGRNIYAYYLKPTGTGTHTMNITNTSNDIARSVVFVFENSTSVPFSSGSDIGNGATIQLPPDSFPGYAGYYLVGVVSNVLGGFSVGNYTTSANSTNDIGISSVVEPPYLEWSSNSSNNAWAVVCVTPYSGGRLTNVMIL